MEVLGGFERRLKWLRCVGGDNVSSHEYIISLPRSGGCE